MMTENNYTIEMMNGDEGEVISVDDKIKCIRVKFKDGKEFYVKLFLDPEITHSKEGLIELKRNSFREKDRLDVINLKNLSDPKSS